MADDWGRSHGHGKGGAKKLRCGKTDRSGYEVIFDGSRRCFERWRYAGGRRSPSSDRNCDPALAAEPRANRMHWSSSSAALAVRRTTSDGSSHPDEFG
jgi:hypothetical protein